MSRSQRFALAYAVLAALAVGAALWRGESPFELSTPWLSLSTAEAHGYSLALGVAFGAVTLAATRASVSRFDWARRLHADLRPVARSLSAPGVGLVALMSALGEELMFRGLLLPWIGLFPQALLFGLLHQMPGRSRWSWAVWAALVGLVLGCIYGLTGSLVGPLVAHALVNWANLLYLRAHDPAPARRALGGLLGQRG